MTKADRIRELYKTDKYTTGQIADMVGCDTPYVRVAARQRKGGAQSEIDKRYKASPLGRLTEERLKPRKLARARERYASDPEFRRKRKEHYKLWYRERGGCDLKREYGLARRAEARAS